MGKLRIKLGDLECDYEGSEDFTKADLLEVIDRLSKLPIHHSPATPHPVSNPSSRTPVGPTATSSSGVLTISRSGKTCLSVARALSYKSGPELAIAAAAYIQIVLGHERFTRKMLLDSMKTASGLWKGSHDNNMDKMLKKHLDDEVFVKEGRNSYTLGADKRSELEKQLGQG